MQATASYAYGPSCRPPFGATAPDLKPENLVVAARYYIMMRDMGHYAGQPCGIIYYWIDVATQVDGIWTRDIEFRDCGHTLALTKPASFVNYKSLQCQMKALPQCDRDTIEVLGHGPGMQQSVDPVLRPDAEWTVVPSDARGVRRTADVAFVERCDE